MCGIAGIIGTGYYKPELEEMLQMQTHRGPDCTAMFFDEGFAGLGHNRLAIIDLSSNANQPFTDISERYTMVFNGEIYNYLELRETLKKDYNFKTKSDTEVLLALYIKHGKTCLDMLNGMFAFAIWDKKLKTLFAARDRFGIKPLYYYKNNEKFVFSSEIKAIHKCGVAKKANQSLWGTYFSEGSYGSPAETFWKDISQLPGGHYLEYKDKHLALAPWYDFVCRVKTYSKNIDYEEAKAEYTKLLADAINLRFRADVPVGFNLSGGLDSSTLLAMSNVFQNDISKIEAFTFYTNHEDYDELPWVRQIIQQYNNPLNTVLLNAKEVSEYAQQLSHFQDEPYGGIPTLAYAQVFKSASKKGIKVLLDGQGMDEQLVGYDYYRNNTKTTIQGVKKSPFRKQMLNSNLLDNLVSNNYPKPFETTIENLQYRDLFYTKIPRALRFNDRVSMMYSTELRVPFLDYRLVEFGFALPLEFKVHNNQGKHILRDIISKHVDKKVSYAPKRPLQTPQREWLADDLKSWVTTCIDHVISGEYASWFNRKEVDKAWQNYLNGDQESSFHIWQLINFSLLMS